MGSSKCILKMTKLICSYKSMLNHDLNEQADQLAKEGTTSSNVFVVPKSCRYSKHDNHLTHMKICVDRWAGQPTCRQTRLMIPRPSTIVTDYLMTLDKADCSLLLQYFTGHNYKISSFCNWCLWKQRVYSVPGWYRRLLASTHSMWSTVSTKVQDIPWALCY